MKPGDKVIIVSDDPLMKKHHDGKVYILYGELAPPMDCCYLLKSEKDHEYEWGLSIEFDSNNSSHR